VALTALKEAFDVARTHHSIDVISGPLLASKLFVVAKEFPGASKPQFYVTPVANRICVTAAESRDVLAGIPDVVLIEMSGRELLDTMEPFLELMIVHEAGGEYLNREQLDWLRELRNVTGTP
jgi:hypothetical protein